jgi:putative membrane protein
MRGFLLKIVSSIVGLWAAVTFVPGVDFTGTWKGLLVIGVILGLANAAASLLKIITLPLRILTLGIFGVFINILVIWLADVCFRELIINGLTPLLWTTLIVWGAGFIIGLIFKK